jgi:hypothetical protein
MRLDRPWRAGAAWRPAAGRRGAALPLGSLAQHGAAPRAWPPCRPLPRDPPGAPGGEGDGTAARLSSGPAGSDPAPATAGHRALLLTAAEHVAQVLRAVAAPDEPGHAVRHAAASISAAVPRAKGPPLQTRADAGRRVMSCAGGSPARIRRPRQPEGGDGSWHPAPRQASRDRLADRTVRQAAPRRNRRGKGRRRRHSAGVRTRCWSFRAARPRRAAAADRPARSCPSGRRVGDRRAPSLSPGAAASSAGPLRASHVHRVDGGRCGHGAAESRDARRRCAGLRRRGRPRPAGRYPYQR